MFVGTNTLELNEATMKAVVEYWLINLILNHDNHSPTVTSFKSETQNNIQKFIVGLKQEEGE